MATEYLRLCGITYQNRHQVIASIGDAIISDGGWILDFQLFSNLSINVQFEFEKGDLSKFSADLQRAGIKLYEQSQEQLKAAIENLVLEMKGSLQITFVHDEPDLRREVPAY